jgi:formylglycine-generating enzyme required for sulfatase activity
MDTNNLQAQSGSDNHQDNSVGKVKDSHNTTGSYNTHIVNAWPIQATILLLAMTILAGGALMIASQPWRQQQARSPSVPAGSVDEVADQRSTPNQPLAATITLPSASEPQKVTPSTATKDRPFVNSLGMLFVPVMRYDTGKLVLFCIWETRRKDYEAFASTRPDLDLAWKSFVHCDQPVQQRSEHPAAAISHTNAVAFCEWLTKQETNSGRISSSAVYRLPTDLEWSYAIGIGELESSGTPAEKSKLNPEVFLWGKQWLPPPRCGNFKDKSYRTTYPSDRIRLARIPLLDRDGKEVYQPPDLPDDYNDGYPGPSPVGSFPANKLGIFDLEGNVSEWCDDLYDSAHDWFVARGGSWGRSDSDSLQAAYRAPSSADSLYTTQGFRCALIVGD